MGTHGDIFGPEQKEAIRDAVAEIDWIDVAGTAIWEHLRRQPVDVLERDLIYTAEMSHARRSDRP